MNVILKDGHPIHICNCLKACSFVSFPCPTVKRKSLYIKIKAVSLFHSCPPHPAFDPIIRSTKVCSSQSVLFYLTSIWAGWPVENHFCPLELHPLTLQIPSGIATTAPSTSAVDRQMDRTDMVETGRLSSHAAGEKHFNTALILYLVKCPENHSAGLNNRCGCYCGLFGSERCAFNSLHVLGKLSNPHR